MLSKSNIGKFEQVKRDIGNMDKIAALQKLYSLVDDNLKETNKKFALTKIVENNLNSNQALATQFNAIATQHPFYGGEAVYIMRAFQNKDIEDEMPSFRKSSKDKQINYNFTNDLQVYPNPTNGKCLLVLKNELETDGKLNIYNSINQAIYKRDVELSLKYIELNLNNFKNGIYNCIIIGNAYKYQQKIIILK